MDRGHSRTWAFSLLMAMLAVVLSGVWTAPFSPVSSGSGDTSIPLAKAGIPVFNEADLVHGGSGAAGPILRGAGIVRTSGSDRATPWELIVPAARLRADIVKVGLAPGIQVGAPDNPEVIGWWEDGPAPGQRGNVILDGHKDYTDINGNVGIGVCWELGETRPGNLIVVREVDTGDAWLYQVTELRSFHWNSSAAIAYLDGTLDPVLTLVTCEGAFDQSSFNYSNRLIVRAELKQFVVSAPTADRRIVPLRPGWNLLGWTVSGTTELAQSGLVDRVARLFVWDASRQAFDTFAPTAPPFINSVRVLRYGQGAWALVPGPATIEISLPRATQRQTVALEAPVAGQSGFSLVVWTGPDGTPVKEALRGLDGDATAIFAWDTAAQRFLAYYPSLPSYLSQLTRLDNGQAIWVQVKRPLLWRQG